MLKFYTSTGTKSYQQTPIPKDGDKTVVTSQEFTKADAAKLVEKYGMSEGVLNDVFDMNELPRIESEGHYKYIFMRNFTAKGNQASSYPVLFITNAHVFACLSVNKQPTSDLLAFENSDGKPLSVNRMLIKGIAAVTQRYEDFIDHIGEVINKTEQRMRSHEATNEDFFAFVNIEGSLNRANMNLSGLAGVIEKLSASEAKPTDQEKLEDIQLFIRQLLVEISSHLQSIKSIREAYSTVASNTLNERMKVLTTLTLLIALPNVFYGMFGMNVELPFMREPWAYSAIVLFTLLVIIFVYIIARRKKLF